MKLQCPKCSTGISVDENKYQTESIFIACPKCEQKIKVNLPAKVVASPNNIVPVIPNIPNISNITQNNTQYEEKLDTGNNVFGLQVILGILILFCLLFTWYQDTNKVNYNIFQIPQTGMAVGLSIIGCTLVGMFWSSNTNNAKKVARFCMLPILGMSIYTILYASSNGGQAQAPLPIFLFAFIYLVLALTQRKAATVRIKIKSKLEQTLETDEILFKIQVVIAVIIMVAALISIKDGQLGGNNVIYTILVVFSVIILILLSQNTDRKRNKNVKRSTLFIVLILVYIFCITVYQTAFLLKEGIANIIILIATFLYGILVAINVVRNKGNDFIPEKQPIIPIPRKTVLIVSILLAVGVLALIGEGVYSSISKNPEISSANADNTNSTSDIYITVTAEKAIKLRKTPSLDLEEINIIPTGTRLKLIEKTNQKDTFEGIESYWYKVQYANTTGYVFGGFTDADKRAVANNSSTSSTQTMLQNYYQAVENGTMRAENYFSPSVVQFITVKNTTPQGVNQVFASNTEFVNQQSTITSDLTSVRQENGINYYTFWTSFRCLRRSMNKYQLCNTKVEVGIDQNTKICSYKETSVDNLRYVDANGSSQNAPDYPGNSENYEREVPSGYAQAITESGCTIRSEPTVRSEQTDFVPRWEMMQVLAKTNVYQKIEDKSGYWYKISYNGKEGYCFGGFMKVNF